MRVGPDKCLVCEEKKDDLKEAGVSLKLVRDGKTIDLKFTAMVCNNCADESSAALHELSVEATADGVPMTLEVNGGM